MVTFFCSLDSFYLEKTGWSRSWQRAFQQVESCCLGVQMKKFLLSLPLSRAACPDLVTQHLWDLGWAVQLGNEHIRKQAK